MRIHRASLLALVVLGASCVLACGGGGGEDPPPTTTVTLLADPALDGRVANSGFLAFEPSRAVPFTGDMGETFNPTYDSRQLYAFHLGPLPRSTRILRATLRIYQGRVVGEPYTKNGDVIVDHVDYVAAPGAESWDEQTLERDIGTLSSSPTLGWRTLDVTAQVLRNLADGLLWSQYRLRFWIFRSLPPDDQNDLVYFSDAEDSSWDWDGVPPELVVEHE